MSKLKWLAVIAQSIEAMCSIKNEDVVGIVPTGDAPTTSEWSIILLPAKVRLAFKTTHCISRKIRHMYWSKINGDRKIYMKTFSSISGISFLNRIYFMLDIRGFTKVVHIGLNLDAVIGTQTRDTSTLFSRMCIHIFVQYVSNIVLNIVLIYCFCYDDGDDVLFAHECWCPVVHKLTLLVHYDTQSCKFEPLSCEWYDVLSFSG